MTLFNVGFSAASVSKVAAEPCKRDRISGIALNYNNILTKKTLKLYLHSEMEQNLTVSSFPISRTTLSVTML